MRAGLHRRWMTLRSLFRRRQEEDALSDEIQTHLDLLVEEQIRHGLPPTEAHAAAHRAFGGVDQTKERYRDSRGLPWLNDLFQDARFAVRGLRRDRTFALTAIGLLAIAITLNVAAFTVMDAMLFRGLPMASQSDRLVYLRMRKPADMACCPGPLLYSDFEAWRSQATAFDGLTFGASAGPTVLQHGNGRSLEVSAHRRSANTFSVLGVRPLLGRDFVPADERPGATPVVILSHSLWTTRFGARPDVIGVTVSLNETPTTIIGVMPKGFVLVYDQDLWMPLTSTPRLEGGAIGRLRDGTSAAQARTELETITQRLNATDPSGLRGVPVVAAYTEAHVSPDAPMIYGSMWVGAWFVLLIACANLANLTLVRTLGRSREFSTRMALGAGRGRMLRQLAVEHALLAVLAATLAWWGIHWSVETWAAATATQYLALDYAITSGTLGYLLGITTFAAAAVSLLPMAWVVRQGTGTSSVRDARGITAGLHREHLGAALVAGQMALAIVLLSGAGVLARSFDKVVNANTGVRDPEHIVLGLLRLPLDKHPGPETRVAYFDRLLAAVKPLPGVDTVSLAAAFPARVVNRRSFEIEGAAFGPSDSAFTQFLTIGSDYLAVLGMAPVAGRMFDDRDHAAALRVTLVNQSFVDTFLPGQQIVGKRLRTVERGRPGPWLTVVGVAPNIMQGDATRQTFRPVMYVPYRQQPFVGQYLLVRATASPDQVARRVRAEVQRVDPDVNVIEDFATLKARLSFDRDYMDLEHAELGKHAGVAPILALIALLVATVGLYAVMTCTVTRRTREIGVRVAIGATATQIRRLVFQQGMRPVVVGLIGGLVASLAINRLLESQLVGVSPYDPVTLAVAPVLLILVALLACHIPAQRALRVDPAVALRHE